MDLNKYDLKKENLFIKVGPIKGRENILEKCPHYDIEDLTLTYHLMLDRGMGTMLSKQVDNIMLQKSLVNIYSSLNTSICRAMSTERTLPNFL